MVFFKILKGTLAGFLSLFSTTAVSFRECVLAAFVRIDFPAVFLL